MLVITKLIVLELFIPELKPGRIGNNANTNYFPAYHEQEDHLVLHRLAVSADVLLDYFKFLIHDANITK